MRKPCHLGVLIYMETLSVIMKSKSSITNAFSTLQFYKSDRSKITDLWVRGKSDLFCWIGVKFTSQKFVGIFRRKENKIYQRWWKLRAPLLPFLMFHLSALCTQQVIVQRWYMCLYKVPKQAKLVYAVRNQDSGCCWNSSVRNTFLPHLFVYSIIYVCLCGPMHINFTIWVTI